MSESHCASFVSIDRMFPFVDITLPPCSIGRLAGHLMFRALESDGYTKEMGFSSDGKLYMHISFPKSEKSQQFCEKANATIDRWMVATSTPSPVSRENPDWKANLADALRVYQEMQERFQPFLNYLKDVNESDAIDVLEKAYALSPELEQSVLAFGKMVQAYLAAEEPQQAPPNFYGHLK